MFKVHAGWWREVACMHGSLVLTKTYPEKESQSVQIAEGRSQWDDEDGVASLNCHGGPAMAGSRSPGDPTLLSLTKCGRQARLRKEVPDCTSPQPKQQVDL